MKERTDQDVRDLPKRYVEIGTHINIIIISITIISIINILIITIVIIIMVVMTVFCICSSLDILQLQSVRCDFLSSLGGPGPDQTRILEDCPECAQQVCAVASCAGL